jgi:hypothetical protein
MEELFQIIVEQNEKILSVLERIDEKLDVLAGIEISATSIDSKLDEIKSKAASIENELTWHENLSTAAQVIKAVEDVACAIRE